LQQFNEQISALNVTPALVFDLKPNLIDFVSATQSYKDLLPKVDTSIVFKGALMGITDAQRTTLAWLHDSVLQTPAFDSISHLLAQNNTFLSTMVSDLDVLGSLRIGGWVDNLMRETAYATKALHTYVTEELTSIAAGYASAYILHERLSSTVVRPTSTTALLVSATRQLAEADTAETDQARHMSGLNAQIYKRQVISRIRTELYSISPRFGRMLDGAWTTLRSASPDRHRQVMHSLREIIMQVLESLAPDNVFTDEERQKGNKQYGPDGNIVRITVTRNMRIKHILSGRSEGALQWVEATADAVCFACDEATAESHRRDDIIRYDDEATARFLLTTISLIGYIVHLSEMRHQE
ncbi:MAG: hypothetical protein WCD37_19325, partial [Chloroflexia bacterium]